MLKKAASREGENEFVLDDCDCGAHSFYTIDTVEKSEGAKLTQNFIIYRRRQRVTLAKWHRFTELAKSSVLLFLIARGREQNMITVSASQDRHLCTEIRKRVASGQSIRYLYRDRSKKFWPQNFTRSKRNNRRTVSENLCGTRLDKKAERLLFGFAFVWTFYRFLRDFASATSEPQLKAIANEIETRLKEDHGFGHRQLTDSQAANGLCSITCK